MTKFARPGRTSWRGDVLSLSLADCLPSRLHVGAVAAAVRPRDGGGLGAAVERGFALIDSGSTQPRPLPGPVDGPDAADERGRL